MTPTKRNQPKSDVSARPTGKLGKNQSGQAKTKSKASKDKSIHLGMKSNYWYIHGVAYDFTKFIDNHPGGRWAINLGRGRECSGMLHSYHLNMPAESLLAKYRLPESEQLDEPFAPTQKFTFDENGFFKKTQRDAMAYFKEKNLSHKAPWSHFAFFVLNVVMMLVGLYYMVKNESYLAAAFHGVWRSVLVVQTTHAASHFSFSHNPTVNRWAYRLGTVLIGLWCPTIWDLQHVVAHHIYTNEWPYDTDSAFPLKSLFANQRRFGMHKLQHIYMWFVYALTIPLVMLNSIKDIILGRQVLFRIRYQHIADKIEAWGCSIGSVIYLLIPFYFLGFSKALPLALLSSVISSLYFSMQFVVNHEVEPVVHSSTESYLPPANPDGVDWGAWQLANSLTFNPHSWWALMFSGGLNTQVEHHLFPGVHFSHYRNLVPIIQRNAKKFGLKYHYCDDLTTAVKLHYRLLKNPPDSIRH